MGHFIRIRDIHKNQSRINLDYVVEVREGFTAFQDKEKVRCLHVSLATAARPDVQECREPITIVDPEVIKSLIETLDRLDGTVAII